MKLKQRLRAETPRFFKRLQVFGGSLAALGIALVNIPGVPEMVKHISEHLVWIGPVVALVSQFAVDTTKPLPDEIGV